MRISKNLDGRIITRIDAAECVIPLDRPVKFKGRTITARTGLALKLVTRDGTTGQVYSSTRGTPLLQTIEFLARDYLGADSRMISALGVTAGQKRVNGRPALTQAISLFDIALWDIAAKAAQLPLYQMLGGLRNRIPMMAVAGYFLNERTIDDVRDEVARYIDQGYSQVKINLSGEDPVFDRRYVHACMAAAEGRLAADAHWSWQSMGEALATCSMIDDEGLRFIEDPFGVQEVAMTCHLQSRLKTPIAYGEDLTSIPIAGMALKDIRVFRLDPTSIGGVSGAVEVLALAKAAGCVVMPHVHPILNGQIAGAANTMEAVEIIPDKSASGNNKVLLNEPVVEGGVLHLSEEPGVGLDLNWESVARYASKTLSIEL